MTPEEGIKLCEEVAEEREQAAREWHDCCEFPPIGDTQKEEDACRESARECKQACRVAERAEGIPGKRAEGDQKQMLDGVGGGE